MTTCSPSAYRCPLKNSKRSRRGVKFLDRLRRTNHSRHPATFECVERSCDDTLQFALSCEEADLRRPEVLFLFPGCQLFCGQRIGQVESHEVNYACLSAMRKIASIGLEIVFGIEENAHFTTCILHVSKFQFVCEKGGFTPCPATQAGSLWELGFRSVERCF